MRVSVSFSRNAPLHEILITATARRLRHVRCAAGARSSMPSPSPPPRRRRCLPRRWPQVVEPNAQRRDRREQDDGGQKQPECQRCKGVPPLVCLARIRALCLLVLLATAKVRPNRLQRHRPKDRFGWFIGGLFAFWKRRTALPARRDPSEDRGKRGGPHWPLRAGDAHPRHKGPLRLPLVVLRSGVLGALPDDRLITWTAPGTKRPEAGLH